MNNFYVYEHWRPDTNQCFYVGKGRGKRAYDKRKCKRSMRWLNVINKSECGGMSYDVRIIKGGLTDDEAKALEVECIKFWRGVGIELVNMTNGGDGCSGYVPSAETCARIAAANKDKKLSAETREKLSIATSNMSEEQRCVLSRKSTGNKNGLGKHHSVEARDKISAALKGNKYRLGHKHPEEVLVKISVAVRQSINVTDITLVQMKGPKP